MPELGHRTRARAVALVASVKLAFAMEMADLPTWLLLEEAIDIFRELDDRYQVMAALDFFSYYLALVDDRARARAAHEEHLTLAQELGDAWSETQALGNLAIIAGHEGDSTRARSLLEATLARARQAGDLCRIALTLDHLGRLMLHHDGDPGRSRVLIEECRTVREHLGDKRNMSLTYLDLALVYRAGEDLNRARELACTAMSLAQDTGLVTHGGAAHAELGKIALLQHDPARALVELRQALESYRGVDPGISPEVVDCLDSVAELALQTGDTEAAARFLCASDELIRRAGLPRLKTWPANYHQAMMARVRRTLDAESFEHHRAAAIEWSLDEAIAAALAWEPAIETPDQAGTPEAHHGLSPREIEVLRLMAAGLSNQEIADALYISRRTATSHASHILDKLDLTSRTQAVAYAIRSGIA
jgi:non-specific serine/threonine protein kinase